VTGLNWFWIGVAAALPPLIGMLVAFPFWRMEQPIFGNIVGSAVIFAIAIALIMREHVELDRVVQACLDRGVTCWPEPSAFTRFAIYAFIALAQVIVLFTLSVRVEAKLRRRGYDPEWR
jgi:MFS family permease